MEELECLSSGAQVLHQTGSKFGAAGQRQSSGPSMVLKWQQVLVSNGESWHPRNGTQAGGHEESAAHYAVIAIVLVFCLMALGASWYVTYSSGMAIIAQPKRMSGPALGEEAVRSIPPIRQRMPMRTPLESWYA